MNTLDIPFINKNNKTFLSHYNGFYIEPIYDDNNHLSITLNKTFDLYSLPIYMNSKINYVDWTIKDNFINLYNGILSYRAISNSYNKIKTHYIPRLPAGHKINDMIIPIKTETYSHINNLNIDSISVLYDDSINIKLNKNPTLYIEIAKWNKKNIVYNKYELYFKMSKWGYYESLNKCNIEFNDILYITIDSYDFISIEDYVNNINKLDTIYLRLSM
jgi:hypothetical protein